MTEDQVDRTVVTTESAAPAAGDAGPQGVVHQTARTESRRISTSGPAGPEVARRIVVLVFGLIQIVIGVRIVLLLLHAREATGLVSPLPDLRQLFVAQSDG